MQPWDKDRRAGRMVVALFDVSQPFGFARSHRAQSLRLEALRLFQHGAIPDQQPVLSVGFPLSDLLIGSPQEQRLDLVGFPPLMVAEGAQPVRSSPFPQPTLLVSQFTHQAYIVS